MTSIKIMGWNVNGRSNYLGTYKIPTYVIEQIIDNEPDVFFLFEYVPDCFLEGDKERLESLYKIENAIYSKGQINSVLVGMRKEFIDINSIEFKPIFEMQGYENEGRKPNFAMIEFVINGSKLAILGFRMITGLSKDLKENYDMERRLFDIFIQHNLIGYAEKYDGIVIVGDFNNAKHYGELHKPFKDVEERYWNRQWDNVRRKYVGEKFKRVHYNYNLHMIEDIMRLEGIVLCENEEDYSYIDQYNNLIHDDHFFVSKELQKNTTVLFEKKINCAAGLDHKYIIGIIDIKDENNVKI